jgi:hypothetical protein
MMADMIEECDLSIMEFSNYEAQHEIVLKAINPTEITLKILYSSVILCVNNYHLFQLLQFMCINTPEKQEKTTLFAKPL